MNLFPIKIHELSGNYIEIENFPVRTLLSIAKTRFNKRLQKNLIKILSTDIRSKSGTKTLKQILNSFKIQIHKFFIIELIYFLEEPGLNILNQVAEALKKYFIEKVIKYNEENIEKPNFNLLKFSNGITLKSYQKTFIRNYPKLKARLGLNGYILAFEQGLGKTLTALSLFKALNKKLVIIIAPNSTLYETWKNEILSKFIDISDSQVVVIKDRFININDNTRYFILNYERLNILKNRYLSKILSIFKSNDIGIIVDESHNFLDIKSKRTQELINIVKDLKCKDVLLSSGTPLKSMLIELAAVLRVIDPLFDEDALQIFITLLRFTSISAIEILRHRISLILYRKLKRQVLDLPEKNYETIKIKIKDGDKFTIKNISQKITEYFSRVLKKYTDDFDKYSQELWSILADIESKNPELKKLPIYKQYKSLMKKLEKNSLTKTFMFTFKYKETMLLLEKAKKFEKEILEPLMDSHTRKRYRHVKTIIRSVVSKAKMEAITNVLNHSRAEMFKKIIDKFPLCKLIDEQAKKSIIFTNSVAVAKHCFEKTKCKNQEPLLFLGETKQSAKEIVSIFSKDTRKNPLITTYKKAGVGLTLTMASCIIFIGLPWRDIYIQQAEDRVHRIGQDVPVNIYKILLDTGDESNLSDRMNQILEWSKVMFNELVNFVSEE